MNSREALILISVEDAVHIVISQICQQL